MTGAIFDGVMSGQINATTAAMTGKIRYSGDTMKAMSLQRIQKDMTRLYSQARVDQPRYRLTIASISDCFCSIASTSRTCVRVRSRLCCGRWIL
jgi:hypothetical protein